MTTTTSSETIEINGRIYRVGAELTIAYGRGTQRVRIREIVSGGRVRLDRLYANPQRGWESSPTLYTPAKDSRFCF